MSKKLYIEALFLSKAYSISAKIFQRSLCVMTLKGDAEFKRNLTRGLKKGIWLIFMRVAKSLKICTMIGSFFPKHIKI